MKDIFNSHHHHHYFDNYHHHLKTWSCWLSVEDPNAASTAEEIDGPSWSITTFNVFVFVLWWCFGQQHCKDYCIVMFCIEKVHKIRKHWPQWSPPDRQPLQQQLLTRQRTHGIRSWMRLRRYSDNRVNKVSWLRFSLLCICCHLFLCCLADPCFLQASFVRLFDIQWYL